VKYLIQLQGDQAAYDAMGGKPSPGKPAWAPADLRAMIAHMDALNKDLAGSGELVDAQGLDEPAKASVVSLGADGKPSVARGGHGAERASALAGYWLVDVASEERAVEIAGRALLCPVPEGSDVPPVIVQPIGEAPEA